MPRPWQRISGGLAAGCLALLLAGCEISGTVDVRSDTEVVADLIVTKAEADCLGLTRFAGLVIKGTPDPNGNQRCRAQGTVDLAELKDYGVDVSGLGEYLMVDLALPRQFRDMPITIDITFPGRVVDAGATTASGNQVTLTEGLGVTDSPRTRVVAMSHPGPQWWVIGLVAGFGVGVCLTLVLLFLLLLRRRRLRVRVSGEGAGRPDPVRAPLPPPARPTRPEQAGDHEIWAPPADRGDR